jgi:NAD(P)-dependent dehydrogenase (short-subunit alcohol dehydrogenase family)
MSRNILIIGNSDGIGAAVTRALLARGDRVVGLSKSPAAPGCGGARHEVHDVTATGFTEVLQRFWREEHGFDACIYCAGIGSSLKLPDLSNEARVFDVNLTGMVRTMEVLVPHWIERRSGHFVGLSSLADRFYNVEAPSYSASKAGFSHYLLSMAPRLRGHGISVTNIRFGFVDTKMAQAPRKPLIMTPEAAAGHVVKCLEKRPMQLSVPRLAAAFVQSVRLVQSLRVWAG